MIRIRTIFNVDTVTNKAAIAQVQKIMRDQFPGLTESVIANLPQQLHNPLKHRFQSRLLVAEDFHNHVKGFALLLYAPDLNFSYLDFIATAQGLKGRGLGGALYESVRETARNLGSLGLFFECLPDDPALCPDKEVLAQNKARLKFYERFGARPIINTAYETPIGEDSTCAPYLVFDDLDSGQPLSRNVARKIIRAILLRKYGNLCTPQYIKMVVNSVKDDPVQLRACRYFPQHKAVPSVVPKQKFWLVVNDQHIIHHVHDRGYVEAPVRINTILEEVQKSGLFKQIPAIAFPEKVILSVHDAEYFNYFKTIAKKIGNSKVVYPYVFPIRNASRPPKELPIRAGYYCIDTFTPLNLNAFLAAKGAVNCAMTAANHVLEGHRLAYALVRPPGHHAEKKFFGGFCYFNSTAIAAHFLSQYGKVAVLDIDYHHGNGTQMIFYDRKDVLTVSIHGHPSFAYPYFSGFEDERGEGEGLGFNFNFPLPETIEPETYLKTLKRAVKKITLFDPQFLVIALGLDTGKGDPTGTWPLRPGHFYEIGQIIGSLRLPTLVVQEGGYRIRTIGTHARKFFEGFANAETK